MYNQLDLEEASAAIQSSLENSNLLYKFHTREAGLISSSPRVFILNHGAHSSMLRLKMNLASHNSTSVEGESAFGQTKLPIVVKDEALIDHLKSHRRDI